MEEKKQTRKISKKKIETIKKLNELIKNNNTIIIASVKSLPSRQFQDIRKKLRGKAEVKVVKKNIMLKAIETAGKNLEKLKAHVCEDSAVLFSKEDAFELAGILAENKNPIAAKPGQIAIESIEVEEGPTELAPGPAISELSSLGIKIAVEEGKIAIKEKKVIVKKGEKISNEAASVMSKLEIKPFRIGLEPIVLLDNKTGKIYTNVKIDKEKTIEELRITSLKSLSFAQKIVYYCKETIGFLLGKANANAAALEKLQTKQEKTENVDDKTQENKPEENKEETKNE